MLDFQPYLLFLATLNGSDSSVLRYKNLGVSWVKLVVQETQHLDPGSRHLTEQGSSSAIADDRFYN